MSQKTGKEGPRLSKNQKFSEQFSIRCCPPFTFLNSKREIVDRKYSICKSGCFYQKKEEDWICCACQRTRTRRRATSPQRPKIQPAAPPRWSEHQPSHGPLRGLSHGPLQGLSVSHDPVQRSDHHQPSSAPLRSPSSRHAAAPSEGQAPAVGGPPSKLLGSGNTISSLVFPSPKIEKEEQANPKEEVTKEEFQVNGWPQLLDTLLPDPHALGQARWFRI